jgi:hypothetical protein
MNIFEDFCEFATEAFLSAKSTKTSDTNEVSETLEALFIT